MTRKVERTAAQAGRPATGRLLQRSGSLHLLLWVVVCVVLLWLAAASGHVAAIFPFVIPLLVGELVGLAAVTRSAALTTFLSIASSTAAGLALVALFDDAIGLTPGALWFGVTSALLVNCLARLAEAAIPHMRTERQVVAAALDRTTFAPARLLLALLGRSEREEST